MMTAPGEPLRTDIFGVPIHAVAMNEALSLLSETIASPGCKYVCAVSVHGLMESQNNADLRRAFSQASVMLPDGMPLVWIGRSRGFRNMRRVTGPDVMLEVFRRPQFKELRHFFYGGAEGVAQELQERFSRQFPQVSIVGTFTPPFRELSPVEEDSLLQTLADLKPDVVWIGIGCPKQEIFMARIAARMPAGLMVGVGAAFDFHTGRLRDCPQFVKTLGLQWLHRLLQDPRRLWRRYLKTNTAFLWQLARTAFDRHRQSGDAAPAAREADNARLPVQSSEHAHNNTVTIH